jgi:hypothetical protein
MTLHRRAVVAGNTTWAELGAARAGLAGPGQGFGLAVAEVGNHFTGAEIDGLVVAGRAGLRVVSAGVQMALTPARFAVISMNLFC